MPSDQFWVVLEVLPEGYGFLRVSGFLPSRDDVYVSVKQSRQFGLRKGDYVTGATRPPASSEKYPAQSVSIYLYVEDTDASYRRGLEAGATSLMEPADQFYGDRSGTLKDPFGHSWHLSTHKEDVSPEELNRRMAALAKK